MALTRKGLISMAEHMDFDIATAMRLRIRYLGDLRDEILSDIEEHENDILFNDTLNIETRTFISIMIERAKKELKKVDREIKSLTQKPKEGEITDDMIEAAREYPIENLIEFRNGRCKAFCHDSDSYSVAKSRNANGVWCHVCGKFFNPIDILVHRDGFSFVDAVRQLT